MSHAETQRGGERREKSKIGFSQVHFPLPFREEAGLACTPKAQKTHFTPVSLFIGLFLAPVGHFALLFAAL